ncbi:hypothetical protein ES332_A07G215300v1 [Gossypium tomentosum]|uniref:Uncharacterized protein n=1 Tax=Gossypium tomentosum TaxID=34277 RepID=A0A5D2PVM8_GOSTO|nr:hypothetical protein ES332_A07G215300v1 [Gossypium tomentosum]
MISYSNFCRFVLVKYVCVFLEKTNPIYIIFIRFYSRKNKINRKKYRLKYNFIAVICCYLLSTAPLLVSLLQVCMAWRNRSCA